MDPSDHDLMLEFRQIERQGPGVIRVQFSDGHQATYLDCDVLTEALRAPGDLDCPSPTSWDSQLPTLPQAKWNANPSQAELMGWLDVFLRFGFIVFKGVPTDERQVLRAASVFGYVRDTNFGPFFDVRSEPNAIDLAYTSLHLDAHTDNPYRSPVPTVQLLHCLANRTTGGLSTLVDGLAVCEALRTRDAQAFRILSTTPVQFRYQDPTTELTDSAPPIELDVLGRVRAIRFSPRLDFVPLLPAEELSAYYQARHTFDRMLRSNEFETRFLLNSGDLLMFDNCRLLHGRTSFDTSEGLRHLQGCYIDIDGPRSLYRVTRRQLAGSRSIAA